jgi:hypothetical protein
MEHQSDQTLIYSEWISGSSSPHKDWNGLNGYRPVTKNPSSSIFEALSAAGFNDILANIGETWVATYRRIPRHVHWCPNGLVIQVR